MKFDFDHFVTSVSADEFENFYRSHNNKKVKEQYCLSDYYLDKVLAYFSIAHKTKEETDCLIKECFSNKTEDEKAAATKKRLETVSNWSQEKQEFERKKRSESRLNFTEEQKLHQLEAFRATLAKRSEEQINATKQKQRQNTLDQFARMTDEERVNFSEKMKSIYASFSDEKKQLRIERIKKTRAEKGIINCFTLPEVREKIKQTNLKKYGVPYYCMTQECRFALGGNSSQSKPNLEFRDMLIQNGLYVSDELSSEFPLNCYSYHFKVDNKLIEINPTATHNSTWSPFDDPLDKKYHFNKSQLARDNGYLCIHIWDWDDKDKIIRLLLPRETVYARKCIIKEVDLNTTREYLNTYHLQGYAKDSIRIGLFYDDKLVSIMTFAKPRYNKNYQYELIRYCSSYNVIGGAEKLFSYFVKTYTPESIISYCDWSKFTGDVYEKLGFTFRDYSISKHWYNMNTNVHITDNLLRQRGFDQLFGTNYGKGTSNEQLMLENDFVEVYDAGQASYIWRVDSNEI